MENLAMFTRADLDAIWHVCFTESQALFDKLDVLYVKLAALPYPSQAYVAVRDEIDVLLAALREKQELRAALSAELARRAA